MNDRVTMSEIARQAGVHPTTVSLALRNHPSLPVATRERLQALAKQMGYEPDAALAALVAYRRQGRPAKNKLTLAYVTNWTSRWGWKKNAAHAQFFAGATARAGLLGFQLEHFWAGEEGLSHKRLNDMLRTRGITGIILAAHHWHAGDALRLEWEKFSSVKIDFFPHEPAIHSVTNDQRAITQLMMQRVRAAGYRRIGFVLPEWWDEFVDLAWSAGFLAAQQKIALEDRIPILAFPDPTAEAIVPRAAFEAWYRRYQPEVLISSWSFFRGQLEELGLSVPGDVAFAEIFLEDGDGRIAGVRHNCERVGELAVEILVGQLQQYTRGVPAFATVTQVEGTWFDGASLPVRVAAAQPGSCS